MKKDIGVSWIKRNLAIIATTATVLASGGCSYIPSQIASPVQQIALGQQVSEEPPKALTTLSGSNTITPRLIWRRKMDAQPFGYVEIYPQLVGKNIIAADRRTVHSFNQETGKLAWKQEFTEDITGGLNSNHNTVFFGTQNGSAIALDSSTGKTRWITLLKQPIVAISSVEDDKIVFRTQNGKIQTLSTKNGELLWQRTQQTPSLSLQGSSTPIIAGPYVITGFDNGSVAAYKLTTGEITWITKLGIESNLTQLSKLVDIDAEMKAIGTALFAVSYQGSLAGIDMRSGKTGWKQPISSFTGIDANEKELFISDNQGKIWKLNPLTGATLWKNDDLERRSPTAPTLVGKSQFVVGDSEGYLHWYHTGAGKIIGRVRGDNRGYAIAPIVHGNKVYTLGKGGVLSVYSASTKAN